MHRRRPDSSEQGAALVEMALVAPFLLLLLLGLIEFGWLFGQFNAVRHATREGARIAAVDAAQSGNQCTIYSTVESSLEGLDAGLSNLDVTLTGGGGMVGDPASITVSVDVNGLTNAPLISAFLPASLSSGADFVLEQNSGWANDTSGCP